ncbi:TRAP transporter large permease [Celeribacter persicus]|uniref:TRAP transporter large permease protein n=1 Tax=Celeribacter persicus TaxID=1651082 RepID=A0A2T5HUQ7_9RHOB|nr:tripartite ATP-independent transporter DctM subunit [Celeribacter persicus]
MMDWTLSIAILIGGLMLSMGIGLPVALGFFLINVVGVFLFMGGARGIDQMISNATMAVSTYSLAPVPLFLVMGSLFFHSGLARRVLDAIDVLIGRLPARLSYLTVTSGTVFAALSGSSLANTGMLGSLMVPEMMKRGYKKHMAIGPILGSGGLAVIIPPSTLAVLFGSLARIDIGALLIAGLLPGVVLAFLYAGLIFAQAKLDPEAAPNYEYTPLPLMKRLGIFARDVVPMVVIVMAVVGSILTGVATPTESGALGIVAVAVLALLFRALDWKAVTDAIQDAARVTGMTFLLITASSTFAQLLAFSGASSGLVRWATSLDMGPTQTLLVMALILLVLGMFMDQVSMMLITLPIFVPLAMSLQFDMVWWGLIMLLMLEVSFTTPPFGLLLFVMHGVSPPGTTLPEVARAALPYILCVFLLIALVILFPTLATFLPSLM